jgi:steroid delta-isomerase-like uncharacterized protein
MNTTHPYYQLARTVYDRFGRNDFQGVLDLATDDFEATIIPFGQTFRGKEGFLQFLHGFKDAFPDMEIKIENQVTGEGQMVNEITTTVKHTGPLQTPAGVVPPTGKTVNFTVCEVWGVRDNKVFSIRNYQDAASLMRQLGLA